MGVFSITGLPSNLTYEIKDYDLHDKICDSTGSCSLGAIKNFYITIKYVDGGFNSSNIDYDLKLDFDFRKMHQVTYTGITNNNYPTSVIDGGNLTFTTTTNVPPKIIVFYSNNDRVDYDSYSFSNNVFTYNNVTSDINLKYQEKAYLKTLETDTYFKESTYKTVIDSVQFVDYVDTSNAVKVYDLSEVSGSKDVVGWITSGNDLYIGSEWGIFAKNFEKYFHGMSGIKNINFNNLNTSETTSMGYMFKDCTGLTNLDVSSFDTSKVTRFNRMFQGTSNILSIDVSNFNTSASTGMVSMFDGMSSLSSLNVSNFDTRNVTSFCSMFANLNITAIDLSNFNTAAATNLSYMFYGCGKLVSLDLSNFNTTKVTNMESLFQYCTSLTSIDLSSFDTSNVTIMSGVFAQNFALQSIDISNFNTSKVFSMNHMFAYCEKLKNIYVGDGWNTASVTKSTDMFIYASNLPNYESSSWDVSKAYVGDGGYLSSL